MRCRDNSRRPGHRRQYRRPERVVLESKKNVAGAKQAASGIADAVAEQGMSRWLDTVRRHHEGTYQHCLLVTGTAVDFGLSLGLAKADIERLYSAAMFHDIGKAKIPLAVLDTSPGKLDPQERAIIETHPAAGYDILKGKPRHFSGDSRCRPASSRISRRQRLSRRPLRCQHIGCSPHPDHFGYLCGADRYRPYKPADAAPTGV